MPCHLRTSIRAPSAIQANIAPKNALQANIGAPNGGGTLDHSVLQNRDKPDQHPIGAISGLEAELAGKSVEPMTNADIEMILGGFFNG